MLFALLLVGLLAAMSHHHQANALDFHGIRCQLPGWPGHPAPACDPNAAEDECCPGTHCTADAVDPTLYACRPDATVSELALSAHFLAAHAEFLLRNLVSELKDQSMDVYQAVVSAPVSPQVVQQRVQALSMNKIKPEGSKSHKEGESHFLREGALELLDLDFALHRAAGEDSGRDAVLRSAREVLSKMLKRVDDALAVAQQQQAAVNTSAGVTVLSNATQLPAADGDGEEEEGGFWHRYMPHIPINDGDRRPGSLGGPCGLTNYRDFGPCVAAKPNRAQGLVCVGATSKKPGVCRLNATEAEAAFHRAVVASEALGGDLRSASLQLVLAQQVLAEGGAEPILRRTDNTTHPVVETSEVQYTATTYIAVALALSIIVYFACFRNKKPAAYRPIAGGGWGEEAVSRI